MIIRSADSHEQRFGSAGDTVEASGEMLDGLFFFQNAPVPPLSHVPVKARKLARVAMLASPRVYEGFAWHNSCHELTPANWKTLLGQARPDYLLVESCIQDSARVWPMAGYAAHFGQSLREMALFARKAKVPAIFWHTLGVDMAPLFAPALDAFDIVACADYSSLEFFRKKGFDARPLPWGFSPEHFNPLGNFQIGKTASGPLFDGMARMMRFEYVRQNLLQFADANLDIIDTGMFVAPYNLERFQQKGLAARARGNVSQKHVQVWYKNAAALVSIGDAPGYLAPGQQWRNLEASACRCPVLHLAPNGTECEPGGIAEEFRSIQEMRARYEELAHKPMEREKSAHLAWRAAHAAHTFAHRMDAIHSWVGLKRKAVDYPRASVVMPTIRPENAASAIARYECQTWPNKELLYVFNGSVGDMPALPDRPDIRPVVVPREYSSGMGMNAGISAGTGDYVFRFDDDDLYGPEYLADRMIYFREFDLQTLSNASSYVVFGDSREAHLMDPENDGSRETVFSMSEAAYGVAGFTSDTVGMEMQYARRVPFQEQTYATEDCSLLFKGITLAPGTHYAKISGLNFCVCRNAVGSHTWQASQEEILGYTNGVSVPLEAVFV